MVLAVVPAACLLGSTPAFAASVPSSPVAQVGAPPAIRVSSGNARWLPAPPPVPGWGPAAGEQDLAFTSGGTGFLASGPPAYTGAPPAPAVVQRTTDGGASWATVWREPGYRITWLGLAGGRALAAGLADGNTRPFLLQGSASGLSWQQVPLSFHGVTVPSGMTGQSVGSVTAQVWGSYQFHFVNARLGFAAPDPMIGQATYLPAELLRTTDGGRNWSVVRLPGGSPTGGLAFVNDEDGFATGTLAVSRRARQCGLSQIWATSDGGLAWHAVPGTCTALLLNGLDFPTPSTGYAVGGQYLKYSGYGQQLLMVKTTDGGRRWSTVYRHSVPGAYALDGNPFAQVGFVNPEDGFALDGGQTAGGNGPVGGHLWRTVDGGKQWSQLGVKGLRLVLSAEDGVWLVTGQVGQGGSVLWRSADGGQSWVAVGNPGRVMVSGVAGYGQRLFVATEAGDFVSHDGGRSWQHPPPALQKAVESTWTGVPVQLSADRTVVVGPGWSGSGSLWLSSDGGRTGVLRRLPALGGVGVAAVAFSGPRDAIAVGSDGCGQTTTVLFSGDGGRSWQRRASLDMTVSSLAYSGGVVVATGIECDGAGNELATSTDGGRTWGYVATGNPCGPVSAYRLTVVVECANLMPGGEYLLASRDGGRHWATAGTNRASAPYEIGDVVATGTGQMWASGPPGILWETTDFGHQWRATRLLLPLTP